MALFSFLPYALGCRAWLTVFVPLECLRPTLLIRQSLFARRRRSYATGRQAGRKVADFLPVFESSSIRSGGGRRDRRTSKAFEPLINRLEMPLHDSRITSLHVFLVILGTAANR